MARKQRKAERLLRSAYIQSLQLAEAYHCESIAFPLISSGIYGYPKAEALQVASEAIEDFLSEHDMDVYLAVFDKSAFVISEKLMTNVESYIDQHYVDAHSVQRRPLLDIEQNGWKANYAPDFQPEPMMSGEPLDDLINHLDEPFSDTLLRLIDEKGKTERKRRSLLWQLHWNSLYRKQTTCWNGPDTPSLTPANLT